MDFNTCFETASPYYSIANYSHFVPAIIAVFLGAYAATKTRFSKVAVTFLFFTLAVATWLLNDIVLWTTQNYHLVAFFWSWIDFVDVVFFVLAAYFFGVLARGSVSGKEKLLLLALCIPSFIFTVTGNAVVGFDHTWCEMLNNDTAVFYKSAAEWASIVFILFSFFIGRRTAGKEHRKALWVVLIALLLFLATFSVTEFLAAQTAVYEINLYGLFVLPVFLLAMVFAITNLEVFKIRYLGTQVLSYVLILLVASQFVFLQNSTDALLNGLTLGLTVVIALILLQNEKQELASLLEIEQLAGDLTRANAKLKELDEMRKQFLSFASHQIKSPLGAIKWSAQVLVDGTAGPLNDEAKGIANNIERSAMNLVKVVDEFLSLRKLEDGKMEYHFTPTDVGELVSSIVETLRPLAEHKKLTLSFVNDARSTQYSVDHQYFTQVIQNLIDNAIKYTDEGTVQVRLENDKEALMISVSDNGHGFEPELADKLFEQFTRDKNTAAKIEGTGLGLYIAKQIVEAHHGHIRASSPGPGKGSTFTVQLESIHS